MKSRLALIAVATLTLAACASSPPPHGRGYGYDYGYAPPPVRCYDCGVIERIERVYGARQTTGSGAVIGGIIGAVIGREVSGRDSRNKNRGTVAGAVVGAAAGHAIEKDANRESFDIYIRLDDGRRIVINRTRLAPGLYEGAPVRVEGSRVIPLR